MARTTNTVDSEAPPAVDSDSAPPTYEQALQHRRIEGHSYNSASVFPRDGAYPGPPRIRPARPQSARSRRFQLPSTNFTRNISPNVVTEDDTVSRASSTDFRTQTCMKLALPPMHMCMAITCLILNICAPGTGTILSGFGIFCCTKSEDWTVKEKFTGFGYTFLIGLGQMVLTVVLLLGWIWSIMWGFALIGVSLDKYHRPKDDDDEDSPESTSQESGRVVGRPTSTQTQSSACSSDSEADIETDRARDTDQAESAAHLETGRVQDTDHTDSDRESAAGGLDTTTSTCDETTREVAQVHSPRCLINEHTPNVMTSTTYENPHVVSNVSVEARNLGRQECSNLPRDPPPYEVATETLTSVAT